MSGTGRPSGLRLLAAREHALEMSNEMLLIAFLPLLIIKALHPSA